MLEGGVLFEEDTMGPSLDLSCIDMFVFHSDDSIAERVFIVNRSIKVDLFTYMGAEYFHFLIV